MVAYGSTGSWGTDRAEVPGEGAMAEMVPMGLPVPRGFGIGTRGGWPPLPGDSPTPPAGSTRRLVARMAKLSGYRWRFGAPEVPLPNGASR